MGSACCSLKSLQSKTIGYKGSKEIAGLHAHDHGAEIQRNLENLHANDMLKELKTLFAQQAEHELLQTTRDFHACKQEEGQSVSSYILKMKGYIDNLERLGHRDTSALLFRLVAKGYTQTPGIDYEETFSPVADIRAIWILIAIDAYYDYEIWQMDVKTAFLMELSQ
ncbi:zinc finger, CCHC-type containing protein [Tanacetum coccineum]